MFRPHILCISGSARTRSTNTILLRAIAAHCADLARFGEAPRVDMLPVFSPDYEGDQTPAGVLTFARSVGEADGLLIAAPEYAHGIPGGLKNALDWLVSRSEFPDKPVMMVHASVRGAHAKAALAEVLRTMSARLISDDGFSLHLMGKSDEEMRVMLDAARADMRGMMERFVRMIGSKR